LYPLYPIFAVFSLFTIQKILEKTKKKKIVISIIISIILITSISYLEIKSIDIEHERESVEIFKDVYSITNVINKFNHESSYITLIPILEKNESIVISNFNQNVKNIYYEKNLELEEFIKQNSEKGLTHIVIDDSEERPDFFNKLMKDENSFDYLEKVYDSQELGFKYHVKVFKINIEKIN
jgi:ribosomal protein L20A (L18A)